MLIFNITKA